MKTNANFLLTGDLHLHDKPYANSLNRSETLLIDILNTSKKNGSCPIFLNGDIFHVPRPSYSTAMVFVGFLTACMQEDIQVVVNVGNHDSFSVNNPHTSYLNLFAPLPNVHVVNKNPHKFSGIWGLGVDVLVMPWYPSEEFKRLLKFYVDRESFQRPTVLIAHQPITEGVMNTTGIKKNQDLSYKDFHPEKFLFVFLNDYHEYQEIHDNVWYIGAPLQTKHGEEEQHGIVGVYTEGGPKRWEHLELPSIYSEFKTYIVDKADAYIPEYDPSDYNRIYAPGEMKADLALLYPEASILPSDMNFKKNVVLRTSGETVVDGINDFLKLEMKRYEKKRDRQILRKLTRHYYNKAKEITNAMQ